jgi:tetratricopeptide (TPR) repeat protein
VARSQGEYAAAQAFYEESLKLYQELGDRHGIANVLNYLGGAAQGQGKYDEARTLYAESLSLWRELGSKSGIAYALVSLGDAVSRQGDTVMARSQLEEGLRLCRELGDKRGIALTLENFAVVLSAQTESAQAARLLGAAQSLRKSIRSPLPPNEQERVDRQIAQLSMVLGHAAFTEAWEAGNAMSSEQAVCYALKK